MRKWIKSDKHYCVYPASCSFSYFVLFKDHGRLAKVIIKLIQEAYFYRLWDYSSNTDGMAFCILGNIFTNIRFSLKSKRKVINKKNKLMKSRKTIARESVLCQKWCWTILQNYFDWSKARLMTQNENGIFFKCYILRSGGDLLSNVIQLLTKFNSNFSTGILSKGIRLLYLSDQTSSWGQSESWTDDKLIY